MLALQTMIRPGATGFPTNSGLGQKLPPRHALFLQLDDHCRSTVHTLGTLSVLRTVEAKDSPDGITHVALGYGQDVLPSFAPSLSHTARAGGPTIATQTR